MQDPMLQFFVYSNLRTDLQDIAKPFGDLAQWIIDTIPNNAERALSMRKLLETRDCILRAKLYKDPTTP